MFSRLRLVQQGRIRVVALRPRPRPVHPLHLSHPPLRGRGRAQAAAGRAGEAGLVVGRGHQAPVQGSPGQQPADGAIGAHQREESGGAERAEVQSGPIPDPVLQVLS